MANLYKEAMDQFAKGINLMVPHAVWYDPAEDHLPAGPVAGARRPTPRSCRRTTGTSARLQRLLQGGRHVADIGVLYPIATLQAGYHFAAPASPTTAA